MKMDDFIDHEMTMIVTIQQQSKRYSATIEAGKWHF